jgi:hypothetical protein
MENLSNEKNVKLLVTAKTIKGTSFVGVRDYENKQGEVSNYTINVGITYENVLKNDFNSLKEKQNLIIEKLEKDYELILIEKAYKEIYTSLEKRLSDEQIKEQLRAENDKTIAQSDAQINAYISLAKGVKLHKDSLQLHVFGLVVKKTILQPIEYKQTNSRELTIVKNKIEKICEFKQSKYRTFIFNKAEVKMQGITIE